MERLIPAAASLRVGNPEEPGIMVGPVIDEAAYRRILDYIEVGKSEATLAYQAKDVPPQGYFIPPTIFHGRETRLAYRARGNFRAGIERAKSARSR